MGVICTSTSLTTSIGLSPDFIEANHSSSSFGSQQTGYSADLSPKGSWPGDRAALLRASDLREPNSPLLSLCMRVFHPNTCMRVALLGPCFKTGQMNKFSQDPSAAERAQGVSTPTRGRIAARARRPPAGPDRPAPLARAPRMLPQWGASAVPPAYKSPRKGYLADGQFTGAPLILCGPAAKVHGPGAFAAPAR